MTNTFKAVRRYDVLCLVVCFIFIFQGCSRSKKYGPPNENIFRMSVEAKIPSLDPLQTTDVYSAQAQSLFYDTLYSFHYLNRPLELQPVLAEKLPIISADKKIFTISLKKGIFFHDDECFKKTNGKGREVKASDLIYSFERAAEPNKTNAVYGMYEDRIVGINDFHAGKTKNISGIQQLDDYTVSITLTKAFPRFIYNFTDVKTALLPKECVEHYGDQLARHPVGTGAFLPKEIDLGSKIVAIKNPNYKVMTYPVEAKGQPEALQKTLLIDAGKAVPFLDKVVLEVIAERQPAFLKFKNAEFEVTSIPKDYIPTVLPNNKLSEEMSKLGIVHLREVKGDITLHFFNMNDSVWGKNKDLRHAVALALDATQIIDMQYSGQAVPAQSILDPTMYGYDPKFKSKWTTRDVAQSKELLKKAGYPDGKGLPPLLMPSSSDTTGRHLNEILIKQLAQVGIELKPELMTWPEMMQRKQTGNFSFFGVAYASGVPDADDAVGIVSSKNIVNGHNGSRYKNAKIDELVDAIEAMENGPKRLQKIREFQEILDEDLPIIPVSHRVANQLVQPWVKNHVYSDSVFMGNYLKYHRVEFIKK